MKLYLSSFRLGDKASDLGRMVSGNRRIGVIRNAVDYADDRDDPARTWGGPEQESNGLRQLGLLPEEIDLRKYFKAQDALRDLVFRLDALWVVGGNSFILRRAMRQSGLDGILLDKLTDERFVYAGYSAGVCVIAPSLKGIQLVDDPGVIPEGYQEEIIWEGLGLIPFSIVPHYKSDPPQSSEAMDKVVAFFIDTKIPFIALKDGEVYIAEATKPDKPFNRTA